jgi:hypothetical protein
MSRHAAHGMMGTGNATLFKARYVKTEDSNRARRLVKQKVGST